jgi:hypothetical protein
MKTAITSLALLSLLAACGGSTASNGRSVQTSCSLTLRANATAAEIQLAVNDVLEGRRDPCAGAVTNLRSRQIELERIEDAFDTDNQRVFTLVFRIAEMGPYNPK